MKQKFRKLSLVRVCKEMPPYMSHFACDFDAIVDGTYSQLHCGDDIDSYFLYKLIDGKIVDHCGWYKECQLTQIDIHDRNIAEDMIEVYNLK